MRWRELKPGMQVLTVTGGVDWFPEEIECTVVEIRKDGNVLLDSPRHGYRILRHYTELRRMPT